MNRLAEELVKGILGEEMTPRKETVAIFAGGFKPPTLGHLSVVQKTLEDYPEIDKMIIYVGSGERDSVSQEKSIAIWRIYQKYLPAKVEVQPSPEGKPPVGKVYSYAKKNPDKNVYMIVGSREGNEGDEKDFAGKVRKLTNKPEEYPNLTAKKIDTGDGISGTRARKAILDKNKEAFLNYIPDIPEKEEIWNTLSEVMGVMEDQNPIETDDQVLARKGAFVYMKGKKIYLKRRRLFTVLGEIEGRVTLEDQKGRQFWVMKHEMDNKWSKFTPVEIPVQEYVDQQDVEDLDDLADRELNPIDVDLSGNHFFDRLNDPRNAPEIDYLELEDFFTKLGDNREEFIDFLNKYKSVVATDTETDINIPFMKMANKAIAKTIMRKRNFKTPNEKIELHEKDPKKGTGKKPKGSGRRLYTDENPKDTVKIKFSTRQDIVDTLNKKSFKSKSHARQSQVINLIHQRVRAAYGRAKKPEVKERLKTALDYITKRKEASKAKTKRLQAQKKKKKTNEALEGIQKIDYYLNYYTNVSPSTFDVAKKDDNIIISGFDNTQDISENIASNHNQKSAPYGSGYKELKEELTPQMLSLTQYMDNNGLNLRPYPKVKFINDDAKNANNLLGRTAYYNPTQQLVALYTMGRHPKDILRSYAHELIHHHQNLSGTLNHSNTTNTNEDGNLEQIEREAYEEGNILFRNWEDSLKNN